jgi:hypothetical protein
MGRRMIQVDRNALEQAIHQAENNGPLVNLDALWKKTVAIYNKGVVPESITFSVAALRAKSWGIVTKTKPGRKGGDGSQLRAWRGSGEGGGKRVPREQKFKNNPEVQNVLTELRTKIKAVAERTSSGDLVYPALRFLPLVDAVAKGSRSAAVKLTCLECGGWTTKEVKYCSCTGCALWPFRPYQPHTGEVADDEVDAEVDEVDAEVDEVDAEVDEVDAEVDEVDAEDEVETEDAEVAVA